MMSRFRHVAHYLAAFALYYTGLLSLRRWIQSHRTQRPEVAVLGLHRILTAEQAARTCSEEALVVLLPTFRKLLHMLKQQFNVLSLADFLCGNIPRGAKPNCLLTFDDAWIDTFENAYPALLEAGVRAAVFVPTGLIGSKNLFWVERLTLLWRTCGEHHEELSSALGRKLGQTPVLSLDEAISALKRVSSARRESIVHTLATEYSNGDQHASTDTFLSWEQLLEMSPVVEAGSHTVNHVLLDYEEKAVASRELLESRAALKEKTGKEVQALAYPSGSFNEFVQQWAASAGYQWAFTVRSGTYYVGDDPLAVPRSLLQEGNITSPWGGFSPAMFHFRLTGWR